MSFLTLIKQVVNPNAPAITKVKVFNKNKRINQIDEDGFVQGLVSPYVNVKDFGAVGDGVVDDTAAIQAAINSFNSSPLNAGGVVFFPSGIYRVIATLTVTTYHVQLVGASKTDCILKTASVNNDILQFNSWYCSVSNMTFDSSVVRVAGYALKMTDGNNRLSALNCEFNNMKFGIQMNAHLSLIRDCEFRTFVNGGSWIEISCAASSAHDMKIEQCTADNGAANKNATATGGVVINQVASLLMDGCSWVNAGALRAMYINPGAGQVVPSIYVTNTFFDQSGYGLRIDGNATGTIQRLRFVNCWFSGHTNDGVFLNSANATGIQGLNFVSCDFYQCVNGINALSGYQDWSVLASRFSGNTTTGIKTTAVATGSFKIADSFIGNGSGFGANALGINIQAGSYGGYQIVDNRGLASNTTGGITDSGSVTGFNQKNVSNNLGATLAGGIAAIIANVTVVANANTIVAGGLNVCPIPANSNQVGTHYRCTIEGTFTGTVTATAIQVHLGTAGTVADAVILTASVTGAVGTSRGKIVIEFTIRTIGAAGTLVGHILLSQVGVVGLGNAAVLDVVGTTTTAPNTTVANYLTISLLSAVAGSSGTVQTGVIEIVKS